MFVDIDNKRSGRDNVQVRLDRMTAKNTLRNLSPFSSVSHVVSPCSDHVTLVSKGEPKIGHTCPKSRLYELYWERGGTLPEVIQDAWESFGAVDNLENYRLR